MERKHKILVCLMAAIMIVSALPFGVFAQDDAQIDCGYVTDGLVSWYDASNHGTSDAVWEDLVGHNDITVEKGYSYSGNSTLAFNDKGLYLKDTGVWLPDALRDLMLGNAFTMEFYVEDAALTGASWLGICTSANRETNDGENMALFVAASNGTMALKFNGDKNQRPTTPQSVMPYLSEGALISVTYDTVAQAAVIYINGVEMGRKPVTNQALVDNTYGIALGTITNGSASKRDGQELTYRSVRFYNRALDANEIYANAHFDKMSAAANGYVTDGLVSHYDGVNRGTTDGVWKDLVGNNDITVEKGYSYSNNSALAFNDKGLYLKDTGVWLPDALRDLTLGEAFTMEFYVEDAALSGASWLGICTSAKANNSGESIALYILQANGTMALKFNGDNDQRPTTTQDLMPKLNRGALVSVTFDTVAQAAVIYINGIEMAREAATGAALANNTYGIALGTMTKDAAKDRVGQELTYRSIRFYDRALNANEVKANAFVDGFMRYSPETLPVMDGLVSWYDGSNRGVDASKWEDLYGDNDIELINKRTDGVGSVAFNDKGLKLSSTWCDLPANINTVLQGTAFTMEFIVDELVQGHTYHGFLGAADDTATLYYEYGKKTSQRCLWLKSDGGSRPTVLGTLDSFENVLISVTYDTVAKAAVIYINGEEKSRSTLDGDPFMSSSVIAALGYTGTDREGQERTYRSIRFYNRALSESEIKANAFYEGFGHHITVDQPATNIVGDVAMTREINSAGELAAMMAAEKLPAAAIYRINKDMQVLDDNGVGFASLLDVLRSTESKVLPVVVPADQDAVSALADWIVEYDFYDISILTKDPALLKAARAKMPVLRGALDLTDVYKDRSELTKDDLINIRKVANTNSATVVRLPATLATKDNVQYLYNRQINVWVGISDTPTTVEKYNALLSGAVGVISDDTAGLLEIACALPTNTMTRTPLNGGHRGLPSKAPECTIEGSMLAYQLGANYIEMDVRLSLDKEVVVIHDGTTNRTCDQNYSITSTNYWGVLEHVKANKGFENDPLFKDCKLSLLDDFFKAFQDIDDCLLVVEIKSEDPAIVPLIKELTEEYGVYDRVFVITFFNNIMEEMRETWPEMSVGALIDPGPLKENAADKTAVNTMKMFGGICTSYDPLTGSLAGNASRATLLRGFQINSWAATTSNLPLRFVSGMASVCHNYADQMGSAVQSFAANVPEKLLLGKSAVISMDLLTYANVDTGDLINAKDVTVTVLEGADLVTVNGNTLTASGLGSVTFIIEYTYECANGNDVQTVSLCTQPITLTIEEGSSVENAIADANYAKDSVVVADRACEAGAGNKYVSAEQMQVLNAAIAALEAAATPDEQTAKIEALNAVLTSFKEATQPGDTHRGEAANSTECKYGCGTTAAAHVLDNEGNPDGGFYLTLQDAIAAADPGDTIKLLADITHATDATPSVITGINVFYIIDKSLTIDGNGHLITNNALARLFLISGQKIDFELKNLKVQNNVKYGKGGDGSIITCDEHENYNENTGSLTITNCQLFSVSDLFYLRPYSGGQSLTIKDSLLVSTDFLIIDFRGATAADYTIEISNSQLYSVSDYIIYTPDCSANIIITSSTLSAPGKSTINDGDVSSKSNITLKGGTVIGKAFSVTAPDGTVISGDAHATAGLILNANNTLTLHNNVQFFSTSGVAFTGAGTVKFGTTDAPYTDTQIIRLSGTAYYFYDTVDAAFTAKQDGDSIFSYAASSVQNKGYVTEEATDANGTTYYKVVGLDTTLIDSAISNATEKLNGVVVADKPCAVEVGAKYVLSQDTIDALNDEITAAQAAKTSVATGKDVLDAVQKLIDALETFEEAVQIGKEHKDEGKDHLCDYGCGKNDMGGDCADSDTDNDHVCDYCGVTKLNDCTPNADDGNCTTAITCSVCGTVTTPAKDAHTPGEDDGNCTTAVYCTECDQVAIAARDAHTGGAPTCTAKAKCEVCETEYGDTVDHKDDNTDHKCDYGCNTEMNMELHVDGDDKDHLCDYGCNEIADDGCYDMNTDGKCDECGEDFAHDCVGAVPCTSTTCKYCGQPVTPVAHDGAFECSTTCIYCHVENAVTDAVAHDGAFDCSTTCKYCNVENTVTDAVAHDGEFDCSTTCKYGCGTEILDAVPCSGLHACSTKCQYCGEAVEPDAEHSYNNVCDVTCKVCNEAIEALPHTGVFGCSATCQWCGTAINAAAHDGEFACSTVCKYGCGTAITDAVAHDGELECSTTCKYCGWENWVADAKNHTGAFKCSDTCQWCGVAIEAAAHDGKYACSTECKWCGAENAVTDAVAHEGEYACSTTCKYGCGATIQNAAEHKGEHACSTTCKVCGAAIAATSADHTFESNGDKCDVCGEAKTESDSGINIVAVIAIVIGALAVIGLVATIIVVKKKD
ncbi:MAG: hypothetical protein J6B09_03480 [Clostridia bacterium]|nr:hypothetical protein [Clostridia bacterium]